MTTPRVATSVLTILIMDEIRRARELGEELKVSRQEAARVVARARLRGTAREV